MSNPAIDEGLTLIGKPQNEAITKALIAEWVESVAPEQLDDLRDEPLVVDALRELQLALFQGKRLSDLAIVEALHNLHRAQYDEVWDQCGGNAV